MKRFRVSEETKKKQHRGEGFGKDYIPYIKANEINSKGTTVNAIDWKTGRTMEFLSQGEYYVWIILRFNDDVMDIREQFPLELEDTLAIANELGYKHPRDKKTRMTSDLLVDYKNGTQEVFSIKAHMKDLENPRTREKLKIEQLYWERRDIKYNTILSNSIDIDTVTNIRLITEFYNREDVYDEISFIKHLIATKQIPVIVNEGLIDYSKLRKELANERSYLEIINREHFVQ